MGNSCTFPEHQVDLVCEEVSRMIPPVSIHVKSNTVLNSTYLINGVVEIHSQKVTRFHHSPVGGLLPVTQDLETLALNSHPATLNFLAGVNQRSADPQ